MPVIKQLEGSIVSPVGSTGVVTQLVIALPLSSNIVGETDIPTPTLPKLSVAPVKLRIGIGLLESEKKPGVTFEVVTTLQLAESRIIAKNLMLSNRHFSIVSKV